MRRRLAAGLAVALAASVAASGQTRRIARTPWGDPDLQGEWTSEGEYGVPFERPVQFGTRQLLTDAEYADRLKQVDLRDKGDLDAIDVLTGRVEMPTAPVPHWREQGTTSRRTSLVIDPPEGRLPPRVPGAKPFPPLQTCGGLLTGDPCDAAEDYGLGVRCIVHGAGFPEAIFPTVYDANIRILQGPGYVAITYELIHDTRIIPLDGRPHVSPRIGMYIGDARGRWDGDALVIDSTNFSSEASYRGSTKTLHLVERFSRVDNGAMRYQVTASDPATWTAPWTAALDLTRRPNGAGVFEYACHEGNYGMFNMLSTARLAERKAREAAATSGR